MARVNDAVIGLVGGKSVVVSATPTLDTNAYASGDHMGTLMTLTGALRQVYAEGTGNTAVLQSIRVLDKAAQGAAFDILLFNASPTITSSDNAAISITDAEMDKCIGVISVATTDYDVVLSGGNSVATLLNVGLLCSGDTTSLYALLVSRGSPTYAASSLVLQFGFLQD